MPDGNDANQGDFGGKSSIAWSAFTSWEPASPAASPSLLTAGSKIMTAHPEPCAKGDGLAQEDVRAEVQPSIHEYASITLWHHRRRRRYSLDVVSIDLSVDGETAYTIIRYCK